MTSTVTPGSSNSSSSISSIRQKRSRETVALLYGVTGGLMLAFLASSLTFYLNINWNMLMAIMMVLVFFLAFLVMPKQN